MLKGKHIVLGVSGGIAAYKACDLVSRLKKKGAEVRVVMTEHATEFVQPLTFETLSGNQVHTSSFDKQWHIGHIALQKWADILVIAPATANIMAKARMGIADDLLSTTIAAHIGPMLIAPAMNTAMWKNPANLENVQVLRERGMHFVGPESGILACGDEDIGRMSEPADIVTAIEDIFRASPQDFAGRRVVVTAGPTREMLDPVRFLSNRSTGRMGYALAEAAYKRGAQVTLISGPVSIDPPKGVNVVKITSTLDLFNAVTEVAETADVVIQSAAPADFRPAVVADKKIKKGADAMDIHLVSNPDIAKTLGERKRAGQVLVTFAAETNDVLDNAQKKMLKKNADLMVANDVTMPGAGFGVDTNVVTLIDAEGKTSLPLLTKREVADKILDAIAAKLS